MLEKAIFASCHLRTETYADIVPAQLFSSTIARSARTIQRLTKLETLVLYGGKMDRSWMKLSSLNHLALSGHSEGDPDAESITTPSIRYPCLCEGEPASKEFFLTHP
jgi:hypothetical protein